MKRLDNSRLSSPISTRKSLYRIPLLVTTKLWVSNSRQPKRRSPNTVWRATACNEHSPEESTKDTSSSPNWRNRKRLQRSSKLSSKLLPKLTPLIRPPTHWSLAASSMVESQPTLLVDQERSRLDHLLSVVFQKSLNEQYVSVPSWARTLLTYRGSYHQINLPTLVGTINNPDMTSTKLTKC